MTFNDEMGEHEVDRKDALVVVGMHRSGTSAMARVLSLAGAALPTKLNPPGPGNSEGHWEPLDVAHLNDEIFIRADSSWDDPFGPRYIRRRKPPIHRYLARARKIIQDNYVDEDLIVFKDPRISIFPELWHRALSDEGYRVSYILMVRNPREVAESLKVRNGFTENKSLLMWATHMLSADLFTRGRNRIFINYDELFSDTESLLDKIEGALKIRMPRRTWTSMNSIQEFVKSTHRHHKIDNEDNALSAFPEIGRFYAYLRATSKGEIWNEDVSADLAEWLSRLEAATAPIIKTLESTLATNSAQSAARETQLRQDVERLETALREAEHLSTDLTRRLEEAGLNQAQLETLNESARAELTDMAGQLAHSKQKLLTLEVSLDAARQELSERQASFLAEAQKLNDDLSHANEQSEARAAAAALAQADLEAAHAAETRGLTARLTELSSELSLAKAQNDESEARAAAAALAQADLEAAHATETLALTARLSELSDELRIAKAQNEESEARAAAAALVQADLTAAHTAETHALTARLTELSDELDQAKAQNEESQARASAAAQAHAELEAAHAAETHELTGRLTELVNEIEGARLQAERSTHETAQVSVERAEAVQTVAELRTTLAEQKTESGLRESVLSERLSDALHVIADKDAALTLSGAELAALRQSLTVQEADLRRQMAEGRDGALEMERRLVDSEARVAQIEIEKSAADRALQELNARLERSLVETVRRRLQRLKLWPQ